MDQRESAHHIKCIVDFMIQSHMQITHGLALNVAIQLQSLLNLFASFFLFGLFNACSFRFCVNPRINEAMKTVLIGQFE